MSQSGESRAYLYLLLGKEARPAKDPVIWENWMKRESTERVVAVSKTCSGGLVSTVFMGVDLVDTGAPKLFQTCYLSARGELRIVGRYSTWAEAEVGHMEFFECLMAETVGLHLANQQGAST